MQIVFHVHHWI